METRDMPKELGLFYVAFLTVQLYIQLEQFISVQVTLPTLYHQMPSNFMLLKKNLHLNILNIVNLLTLMLFLEITILDFIIILIFLFGVLQSSHLCQ